jgi:ATP-binding cassette subfamily B protein
VDNSRSLLESLPLLSFLPGEVKKLMVDSFVPVSLPFGSPIVREGDDADGYYVLAAGKARVLKQGENGAEVALNTLRPGDSFGEQGLLEAAKRTATVRASTDVELYKMDRAVFQTLLRSNPEIRHYLELQIKHRSLHNFFRLHSSFAKLPIDALRTLITELEPVAVEAGTLVIRQGDDPGPMYIVEEGRLRVFIETDGQRKYLNYLRKGDFFGEMSLFKGARRAANVEAVGPCRLLKLKPETFNRLVQENPQFKEQIEQRIAQYDFKEIARVPLDFAQEILPAEAAAPKIVSPDQVGPPPKEKPTAKAEALGPFAEEDSKFVKKPKRWFRFPHVFQVDEMDCGAASLAMVCRAYGRRVSLARIRQLAHTSLDGTSLKAICTAATELGLAARPVKAEPKDLIQMPMPAIVHWEGNHWVVLYEVTEDHVRVADPAIGLRRIPRKEFEEKWSGYGALFDYTTAFEQAPQEEPTLAWLWPFFRPFGQTMLKAVGLAVIVSALQMLLPIFTQVIVDRVLVEKDLGLLHVLVLCMVAVLMFLALSMIVQRYLLSWAAVRIDAATLDFLTRRMLALPIGYFQSRRTGDIQRRLAGTRQVREFLVQNGVRALTAVVQLFAALLLMFLYSKLLTLVFLLTAPLYALLMWFSARFLQPIFHALEEAFGKYHSYQIDAIKGVETVKALGAESALREVMLGEFLGIARRQFNADFTIMCYEGAVRAVSFLSMILFLWVGALQVMNGSMTIGALVAFNALVALADGAIGVLLPLWDHWQIATVLLNRLHDIFAQEPEQGADHSHLRPVPTLEGRIRLHNVGFQYGGPESSKILEGISVEIPAGKRVAIVGRSGSGKTTFIKCLAGLLEPTEGTIYFDGVDMKTLNYRELRRQIGFVLQENYLFCDTIARNIALGEDEPNMDKVIWAAEVASARDFIERLPMGYDTKVGETGLAISGGQRQRIAIARALYHRPPILIFDEATSALDTESERAVQENMNRLLEGRTAFIIAHRLSTIRDADIILVLEKGKLVEKGTHDELMKVQGLYYYLVSQQLGL